MMKYVLLALFQIIRRFGLEWSSRQLLYEHDDKWGINVYVLSSANKHDNLGVWS
jgi:hypothetical protein